MKKQILLPLAAILFAFAAPAFAASSGVVHLSVSSLKFNGSSGQPTTSLVTLSPASTTAFTITKFSISNTAFTGASSPLPITLSKGHSWTVHVTAQPKSTAVNGTLTIYTSAGNFAVALSETASGTTQTAHSVALNWQEPATNPDAVDSYKVQRSVSGSNSWSTIASPGASTTTWTDRTVASKTKYVYEVEAVDDQGKASPNSNQVTVTIP